MSKLLTNTLMSVIAFTLIGCNGGGTPTEESPSSNTQQEHQDAQPARVVNQTPVATFSNFTINRDSGYDGQLTADDADGDTLKYVIVTQPSHGSVLLHDNGCFTYTPDSGYQGTDREQWGQVITNNQVSFC